MHVFTTARLTFLIRILSINVSKYKKRSNRLPDLSAFTTSLVFELL